LDRRKTVVSLHVDQFKKKEDSVGLLSSFIKSIDKIITDNKGQEKESTNNNIIAIFEEPIRAVQTAIEVERKLYTYNKELITQGFSKIQAGTAIHTETENGKTSCSASVIDYLTDYYCAGIIISDNVKKNINGSYAMRFLDYVELNENGPAFTLYEIFEPEPEKVKRTKNEIDPYLKKAFNMYKKGFFERAMRVYEELIEYVGPHSYKPDVCMDPVLHFYRNRSEQLMNLLDNNRLHLENWTGVYKINKM